MIRVEHKASEEKSGNKNRRAEVRIVITNRGHDYMAIIYPDTAFWGVGRTPNEAIGDVIRTHQDFLNIRIAEKPIRRRHPYGSKGYD